MGMYRRDVRPSGGLQRQALAALALLMLVGGGVGAEELLAIRAAHPDVHMEFSYC